MCPKLPEVKKPHSDKRTYQDLELANMLIFGPSLMVFFAVISDSLS